MGNRKQPYTLHYVMVYVYIFTPRHFRVAAKKQVLVAHVQAGAFLQ